MELKFDTSKTYAIALEGGGAKGAYEAGVWKALEEAGVRYHAVAGTSVGALNGAMMATHDLKTALELWETISFSQVFDADDEQMKKIYDRDLEGLDIKGLLKDFVGILKDGGLDIEPLKLMMMEYIDEEWDRIAAIIHECLHVYLHFPFFMLQMMAGNPDYSYIDRLSDIQFDILASVAPLLKQGGTLVYSTCTVDKKENDHVAKRFLEEHTEFIEDKQLADRLPEQAKPFVNGNQLQLMPQDMESDGFFIACFKKEG